MCSARWNMKSSGSNILWKTAALLFRKHACGTTRKGATNSMRSKEEAHDYRYFPDPDLVPILVDETWVEKIRKELPELPLTKRERFIKDYQIPAYDAGVLTADKALANYYEEVVKLCAKPKAASNWVMGDVMRFLNEENVISVNAPSRLNLWRT